MLGPTTVNYDQLRVCGKTTSSYGWIRWACIAAVGIVKACAAARRHGSWPFAGTKIRGKEVLQTRKAFVDGCSPASDFVMSYTGYIKKAPMKVAMGACQAKSKGR